MEDAHHKLDQIINNGNSVEDTIMRIANAAIRRVRELAGEKTLIIRSTTTELTRKQSELDALARMIACHRSTSGPLSFLRAFDRQSTLVGSMQGALDLPAALVVEPDISVTGNLDIRTGSSGPIYKSHGAEPALVASPKPKICSSVQHVIGTPPVTAISPTSDLHSNQGEINNRTLTTVGHKTIQSPVKPPLKRRSGAGPEYTSLVALAQRREQKNRGRGLELTFQPFQGSNIVSAAAQATALYLIFPFKAHPQTHLLFSTNRDGRSIAKMHQMIDNIGITTVLIKKGDFVFGGFAAVKWRNDGIPFGEGSSSFLFSLSQDAVIPYRARANDACHLYATDDTLTFGKYDVILADNFDGCSAVLENSYGIGFAPGSAEAQTFLAGEPCFAADEVEVWGFFTIEQQ
jgi:hypothetical protein